MTSPRPKFSIITTCKGRLDHLKESLPAMLAQADSEVIVVDYSCPEDTAAYVEAHFPKARTVRVDGEKGFSNWKARNAGAAAAKGDFLVFCDADVVLAKDATKSLSKLLAAQSFGFVPNQVSKRADRSGGSDMAGNQLKGFQVVPRESFHRIGGYDDLLTGYAAGGDTDLGGRLRFLQLEPVPLDLKLIERVIHHDDEARLRFHDQSIALTHLSGQIYRGLKLAVMGIRSRANIEPEARARLYALARQGASRFLRQQKPTSVKVDATYQPLRMFRPLGGELPHLKVSVHVEIVNDVDRGSEE